MSTPPARALRDLQDLDRAHHLHPFTHHGELHAAGTHVIVEGEGVWVTDAEGRRLLDALAGLWCVNVGYGCRRIADAAAEQLRRLAYYPSFFQSSTRPAIELAARLARLVPPPLERAIFCNSGSEANETALKIARAYHALHGRPGKTRAVGRTYGYHGVTLATASLSGLEALREPFGLPLPGFVHVPGPYAYGAGASDEVAYGAWCLAETERILDREDPDTLAAIFVEPVQGAGGVIVPPEGYLAGLRRIARERDILFVADEVITGFGRLGAWFASELWSLEPDLMTVAKGLTSGYLPLGATLMSGDVADALLGAGTFSHGFTYTGHPVAAAAALANLDELEERKLIPAVREQVGPHLQERLAALASHPRVAEVRGVGAIAALELRRRESSEPPGSLGAAAVRAAREEGLIVRGIRDLVAVSPPLCIAPEEIDELAARLGRAFDRLEAA